jgi:hypothetical protein
LSERKTDKRRYLLPVGIIVLDACGQTKTIFLENILEEGQLRGSYDKQNTNEYMVARDVALISTDVGGKQDSYAIVSNIGLYRAVSEELDQDCYTYLQFIG